MVDRHDLPRPPGLTERLLELLRDHWPGTYPTLRRKSGAKVGWAERREAQASARRNDERWCA